MVSIIIDNINAAKALEFVNELKTIGLILNIDFEWKYHPQQWKNIEKFKEKHCEFKFKDPKLATFYYLKWQQAENMQNYLD